MSKMKSKTIIHKINVMWALNEAKVNDYIIELIYFRDLKNAQMNLVHALEEELGIKVN